MKRKLDVRPLPEGNPTASRSTSTQVSPGKMSDPFFYQPYEPSTPAPAVDGAAKPEVKKVGIVPAKPTLGALLGGFKKK